MDVTATGLDYAAYEDAFDRAFPPDFFASRYKCLVFVVWHALHRQGLTDEDFDTYLADSPTFSGVPAVVDDVPPLEGTTTPTFS